MQIMKHPFATVCLVALLASLALLKAQDYSANWSTIDGGGGASSNGPIVLRGTVGQPDAGRLSGGSVTLEGGFWGVLLAIQTAGAPWLSIARTATNSAVVSWPVSPVGYVLEQAPALEGATIRWSGISANQYQTNGTNLFLLVNPPVGNKFFRLRYP